MPGGAVGRNLLRPVEDPLLSVETVEEPDAARLRGELDLASYDLAAAALAPFFDAPGDVTLDLSGLSFVDSSGIRLFIRLQQAIAGRGALVIRSPQPHVARVLQITGLAELGVRIEDPG